MSLRRMFWPVCAILLLVTAVVLFVNNRSGNASGDTGSTTSSSSSGEPTKSAESGVSLSVEDQSVLNGRVKAFSALYFSLSSDRSAEKVKQQVRPYATDAFLKTAQFGFGSTGADEAMKREGARLEVKAISGLVGPLMDRKTILGTVKLKVTKYDRDGKIVTSFTREQEMKWVKPDGVWLILEAPRT